MDLVIYLRPDRCYSVITLEKFSCVASNTGKAGFFVQVFPTYLCITDVSLAPLGVIHCVKYRCTHTLLGIVVDSITFTLLNNKYRVIQIFCIHINGTFKWFFFFLFHNIFEIKLYLYKITLFFSQHTPSVVQIYVIVLCLFDRWGKILEMPCWWQISLCWLWLSNKYIIFLFFFLLIL